MCGRYVLGGDAADYAEFLETDRIVTEGLDRSYNVAPTDPVYTVAEWDGERLLGSMRWGFVPHWAEDRKNIQINARAESVVTKPMFRDSLARKRCLIPADGFYEWEPRERGRTPHWIHRADGFPMAFAGLWSTWHDPSSGELIRTCAIVTTSATGVVSEIHDRMPVSLHPENWDEWLDREMTDRQRATSLIRPIDPDLIMAHEVSDRVNSVRNNHSDLIRPLAG